MPHYLARTWQILKMYIECGATAKTNNLKMTRPSENLINECGLDDQGKSIVKCFQLFDKSLLLCLIIIIRRQLSKSKGKWQVPRWILSTHWRKTFFGCSWTITASVSAQWNTLCISDLSCLSLYISLRLILSLKVSILKLHRTVKLKIVFSPPVDNATWLCTHGWIV